MKKTVMKIFIKIFISMVCGAAVFALCALVNIWCGTSAACRAEMFVYLFLAFYSLIIFVVVLILQLNKVKMKFIIGVTLFSIFIYSIVPLVNYMKAEADWRIYKQQFEVVNPWKTTDRETLLTRLQAGENIDKTNEKGQTLLHYAANIGDFDLMKFAVENGADVNKKDGEGYPAAHYTIFNSWTLLEYLAENGADITEVKASYEPLIMYAVRYADAEVVPMLIKHGVSVHTEGVLNRTPLFEVQKVEVAQVLIDAGVDVNFISYDFCPTAIFKYFQWEDKLEILKLFIEAGADLEIRNDKGNTLLLEAIYNHKVVMILIDAGANINAKNNENDTPLLLTAYSTYSNSINKDDYFKQLQLLVERGADKSAIGSKKKTAYHFLLGRNFKAEEIEFLKPKKIITEK